MKTLISVCSLFFSTNIYCQTLQDSTLLFEKHKGMLNQPLTNFIKLPKTNAADINIAGKTVSYITKNADSVRAIFEGKIISIAKVGNAYLMMTNFGNYSITYYGLSKPHFKEGNIIKRNQFLSTLSKSPFGQYFLTVQFYKDNIEVDPNGWFR